MALSITFQNNFKDWISIEGTKFGAMFVMENAFDFYTERIPICANTFIITKMENYQLLEKYTSKHRALFQQICVIAPKYFANGCTPCYVLHPNVNIAELITNPQYIYKFYFDEECLDYEPMPMPYLKKLLV